MVVPVILTKGTDLTQYHYRAWLLDLLLVTVWMVLLFFGLEHTVKKYLKYRFFWPHYMIPLCNTPFQIFMTSEKSTALLNTNNIWLHFCIMKYWLTFMDVIIYHSTWQRFAKIILSPCGHITYELIAVLDLMLSKWLEVMGIQLRLAALPFTHRNFFKFLESLIM